MTLWTHLFWLIATFFALVALQRWITIHTQGVGLLLTGSKMVALWIYFFLFLPGVLVHEVSHYLAALALRVPVTRFSLWPKMVRGQLILGSVEVRNTDPLRHSIIGVAPLFGGSALVLLIGRLLQFDALGYALLGGDVTQMWAVVSQSLLTPDFWLWLYLLFAVANAMFPSAADRVYWLPVLLFITAITALVVGFDVWPNLPDQLQRHGANLVTFMASAFSIAVAVDVFFVGFIFALEALVAVFTRRRVQY